VFIGSCIDKNYDLNDLPDPTLSPKNGVALPVGSLEKSVIDVLRDIGIDNREELIIAEQDTVYIMYMDTLSFSSPNDDMFPCPNNEVTISFVDDRLKQLEFPITIPTGKWSSGLDSIRLVNTVINVLVTNSTLSGPTDFKLTLPAGLELANPADATFNIPAGASNISKSIRIKDNSILRLQKVGTEYRFYASTELTTNESLSPSKYVNIKVSFTSLDAHTIWGDFDNVILDPIEGNRYMGVFSSLNDSSALLFSNPSFQCDIYNYIGIGGTLAVNKIQTDVDGNLPVQAIFDNGQNNYSIPLQPALRPDNVSAGKTTITFDKNNGQIDRLFFRNPLPNHIQYSFDIAPGSGKGFLVKDGKYIDVVVDARLPLSFNNGTRFYSTDTMKIDLSNIDVTGNDGQKFILYIDYENRFRVALDMDVQFLDENRKPIPDGNNNVIFSWKSKMDAATYTNIAGASPKTGTVKFEIDGNKMEYIKKVQYISLISSAKTPGYGDPANTEIINIHPTDYFKLKFSAFGKFEITL
jgi:hypothetical protein